MSNTSILRNFNSTRGDADYYTRNGITIELDISNLPEEYIPISNLFYTNSLSFNPNSSNRYIGMSIEKNSSDFSLLCIKKEYIDLARKYILFRSAGIDNNNITIETDNIVDMLKYFKIQFENTISTVYNDPILVNTITETYTSDILKKLIKQKMFNNNKVIEIKTETTILENEEFSEYDDPEDYNEDGNEEESIPDNLPF
jgi:hypothetical protein